ncbi:MAG: DUF6314 family protein [Pseudomonadota bacterium]
MATSKPNQLAAFEGRWHLVRRIEDYTGGPAGHMDGDAVFRAEGAGLHYRETGLLRLANNPPIRAERSYLWTQPDPARIEVCFSDGRPFHWFSLQDAPEAAHFCDPDMYRVHYAFTDWPNWRSVWCVTGPRKDYRMITEYAPLALGSGMGDTDMQTVVADGRGA